VLAALGCLRHDAAIGPLDLVADQEETGIIISSESYAAHGEALSRCATPGDAASRARVMRGAGISAARYVQALANRLERGRAFRQVFERTDVLVLPTLPITAADVSTLDENDLSPSRLTRFVGYHGLCAIALPCGLSPQGLPVSVQLVAAPYREDLLLRLGAAFQKATNHHRLRPAAL
jgi:aspartyl-tRNA(Asn)/glutamyl-tRNA(Gln) amidotransferase subunit A